MDDGQAVCVRREMARAGVLEPPPPRPGLDKEDELAGARLQIAEGAQPRAIRHPGRRRARRQSRRRSSDRSP